MKSTTTIWTVTQAYQDATYGNDGEIHAHCEVFKTQKSAVKRVREWIAETVESHYEGNDDWTDSDLRKLVDEIMARGESRCGNLYYKWVNDYEHLAWTVQGHNI